MRVCSAAERRSRVRLRRDAHRSVAAGCGPLWRGRVARGGNGAGVVGAAFGASGQGGRSGVRADRRGGQGPFRDPAWFARGGCGGFCGGRRGGNKKQGEGPFPSSPPPRAGETRRGTTTKKKNPTRNMGRIGGTGRKPPPPPRT